MLKTLLRIVVRLLVLLVVFILLWSMRFRYDHIVVEGETYIVRVQRFSGAADILIPGDGWVPAEDAWSDDHQTPPTNASAG